MAKYIQHQLFYPHPPELVWDYLTKPELMTQWLMPNDFQPIMGHDFQFRINPMPSLDFDGIVYCKVLEISPFTKLTYSWKFGPGDGTLHDSVVNWTLSEKDNGTELLLIHNGFDWSKPILPMFQAMDGGWLSNIQKILKLINATGFGS
jgi:uncharacterized protein YndB with AHSA1/START domain